MKAFVFILVSAFAASVGSAEATVRKCANSPVVSGQAYGSVPGLMLDGEMLGPLEWSGTGRDMEYRTKDGTRSVKARDVMQVNTVCIVTPDSVELYVSLITRDGAVPLMREYLLALVESQENFRKLNGAYATNLATLGFYNTRTLLPMTMHVSESGWSASSQVNGVQTTCSVAVGSVAAPHDGARQGEVHCSTP